MKRKIQYSICFTILFVFLMSLSPVMGKNDKGKGQAQAKKIEKMEKKEEKTQKKADKLMKEIDKI